MLKTILKTVDKLSLNNNKKIGYLLLNFIYDFFN